MYEEITYHSWSHTEPYVDNNFYMPPSLVARYAQCARDYPDAMSLGQLVSKAWLINTLEKYHLTNNSHGKVWAILGGWLCLHAAYLSIRWNPARIYNIDIDPDAVRASEEINNHLVRDNWKFKGVVANTQELNTSDLTFTTGGEHINITPDVVLNTSCEHMDNHWFHTASNTQLIILQTNDNPDYHGHINPCENIQQAVEMYPMKFIIYAGTMVLPDYKRMMLIGYK